jgi:hypothetical protein
VGDRRVCVDVTPLYFVSVYGWLTPPPQKKTHRAPFFLLNTRTINPHTLYTWTHTHIYTYKTKKLNTINPHTQHTHTYIYIHKPKHRWPSPTPRAGGALRPSSRSPGRPTPSPPPWPRYVPRDLCLYMCMDALARFGRYLYMWIYACI